MAEALSMKLEHDRQNGIITRIYYNRGVKSINHSQFADDTLLIGGASTIVARRLKTNMDQFLGASRGFLNKLKSSIYGWNISSRILSHISQILKIPTKHNELISRI